MTSRIHFLTLAAILLLASFATDADAQSTTLQVYKVQSDGSLASLLGTIPPGSNSIVLPGGYEIIEEGGRFVMIFRSNDRTVSRVAKGTMTRLNDRRR